MLTSTGAAAAFIERYRMAPKGTAQLVAHSGVDVEQLVAAAAGAAHAGHRDRAGHAEPAVPHLEQADAREFIEATAGQTLEVPVSTRCSRATSRAA